MKSQSSAANRNMLHTALLIVAVFAAGVFFGTQSSTLMAQNSRTELSAEAQAAFEPLFEVYNLIQRDFIEETDITALVDGAIEGMMDVLDDPYSAYIDPESFEITNSSLSGEFEGIGAVIGLIEETEEVEIIDVLEGSPAEASGLKNGDIFVLVNGESVEGLTTSELAARVRGEAGTTVQLTIRRGTELLEFEVVRARLDLPNVTSEVLEGNVAYVSMAQFSRDARAQVDEALAGLDVNSRAGLILDLRGNPGGLLTTATEIAALFLQDGVILTEEFGNGTSTVFEVRNNTVVQIGGDGTERLYSENGAFANVNVPVVVLVDQYSASASELVAGAWQDRSAVTLIGVTTFGKGTVQVQNQLVNGGGVRLTTARWLTPNGSWITDVGVTPDIIIEIPEGVELEPGQDPQLEGALQYLLTGEVTVTVPRPQPELELEPDLKLE
ncbi:MAG: hypothetical protein OHK0046_04750 [Anaerolineae bacterium]